MVHTLDDQWGMLRIILYKRSFDHYLKCFLVYDYSYNKYHNSAFNYYCIRVILNLSVYNHIYILNTSWTVTALLALDN